MPQHPSGANEAPESNLNAPAQEGVAQNGAAAGAEENSAAEKSAEGEHEQILLGVRHHLRRYLGEPAREWDARLWAKTERQRVRLAGASVLLFAATERRPFQVAATVGLARNVMPSPKEEWQRAEFCLLLPADWQVPEPGTETAEGSQGAGGGWPLQELANTASRTAIPNTWLGYGHTVAPQDPPAPMAPDTPLCGWLVLPPVSLHPKFARLRLENEEIVNFCVLVGLHPDELDIKTKDGTNRLLEQFHLKQVSDILQPQRPSAFQRGGGSLKRWLLRL